MLLEQLANRLQCRGLLLQEHLAGDLLDLGIGQRHTNREAIHQFVQQRDVRERALARAYDHDLAFELLRHSLDDFRDNH